MRYGAYVLYQFAAIAACGGVQDGCICRLFKIDYQAIRIIQCKHFILWRGSIRTAYRDNKAVAITLGLDIDVADPKCFR